MQCPIPVHGKECGADAQTQSVWIAQRDGGAIHFDCAQGHGFHIGPHERWQLCRCDIMSAGHLHTVNHTLDTALRTLAAQKGIQVIEPERMFEA